MNVYRADYHFMCGWIALRYLDDPDTAAAHFARIDEGRPIRSCCRAPITGAAAPPKPSARKPRCAQSYQAAARYPTAYYGQLARAKLGLDQIELRAPSPVLASVEHAAADERVRAADMLYEIGERDVVLYFVADLAEQSTDVAVLEALGELTGRRNDARAPCWRSASPRSAAGCALDHYAFPTIGIPGHSQIAPEIEPSVIYSVARTESSFDQRDKSAANAVGLMQVTPEAGRDTAKRFKVSYDWDRMVSDPVYNTQMGAAELARCSRIQGQPHHDLRRLQCRPRPGPGLDQGLWRSARSQGRSGRLGRAHPALRDAQLRPARDGEPAGLPRAVRERRHVGGEERRARGDAGGECGADGSGVGRQ